MSHKYFTHKDALRQEIPLSAPPSEDTVAMVRNIIASHSENASECALFLDMLGVSLPEGVTA